MGAHVESVDSANWECGAERPKDENYYSSYKTSRLQGAQGNFWSDMYAHFSDHGDRFTGIYLGGGGGLVSQLCLTLATPWTVARQAPLSMGFSRQEYWSGLPFPSPGDLPDPGIEPWSPALQADNLPTELWGKPIYLCQDVQLYV